MATHSSILAWRIPWTEEPGGYSPRDHRVGATDAHHQEIPSTWEATTIGANTLFTHRSWHTIGSMHPWLNLSFRNCRKWLIVCIFDLKDKTPHRPLLHYFRNYFNLVYTFARRSNQSILKEISPGFTGRTDVEAETPNPLVTWCEKLTHWKRPWCWERLKAGGEGDDRGWDGWMASSTQWTWVQTPGVYPNSCNGQGGLKCCSLWGRRVGHDWATELNTFSNILSAS